MSTDWLSRWESNQTGWHQAEGNSALRKFWPRLAPGSRVLVPLCGKSRDLLWLAGQGYDVSGVELSEKATQAFFDEAGMPFEIEPHQGLTRFRACGEDLSIVCGDYFAFSDPPFDALYDRASLIALPPALRPSYIEHTKSLLKPGAAQLLLTLEYDQSKASGPPFSVMPAEVKRYWSTLERVGQRNDSKNSPPRFRQAGISELVEAVWLAGDCHQ